MVALPTRAYIEGEFASVGSYGKFCRELVFLEGTESTPLYPSLRQKQMVSCHCDNSGVITSLQSLQSTSIIRPNETTNDDWDIYLAINKTAKQCQKLSFQYWYVKGHQDSDPNHLLMIEEQHNVDCDKLARAFVQDHPQKSTDLATPEFEVAVLHLKIHGRVICQRVLSTLQQAAAAPAY